MRCVLGEGRRGTRPDLAKARALLVPLLLTLAAAACGGDPGRSPTGVSPSDVDAGGGFACTRVLGFSQTRQWYAARDGGGFEAVLDGDRWELFYHLGAGITLWADPNSRMWTQSDLWSPCSLRSGDPDRVLLTISTDTYLPDVAAWVSYISRAVSTIRSKYPNVREIILQPVVGGPDGGRCELDGATVRATFNHPYIAMAIEKMVDRGVVAGASPEVRSCADYQDSAGHLSPEARAAIGAAIGEHYAGS